jgi:SpoVK/Ycf46/Vps4 family AAA+-type ATPase
MKRIYIKIIYLIIRFTRGTNLLDFSKNAVINENCKIEMEDFMMALEEVKP